MASPTKKPKLNHGDSAPVVTVSPAGSCTAVTALAVMMPTAIFSGHRDGTIRRWDTTTPLAVDAEQHSTTQTQRQPRWTIAACTNLTQHELYGGQELLGIAGLVVRRPAGQQQQPQSQQRTTSAVPTDPILHSGHVLYSWNHQREDMRETNGIPQKIMIWQCRNGERCSALMVDVGRSITTGLFANPLVSCLIVCQLLVEPPTKKTTLGQGEIIQTDEHAVEKVWIDAVLVGLQATCDYPRPQAPTTEKQDEVVRSSDSNDPQPSTPSKKRPFPATATGNLVPFHELTRQRLTPWIVTGGFVRALATVPGQYVVCVSETTRTTKAEATKPSVAGADSSAPPTVGAVPATTEQLLATSGGEAHAITLWDVTRPGTVLHTFKLYDIATQEWTTSLRGSVRSIAIFRNSKLLLTFADHSGNNNQDDCKVSIIDLPTSRITNSDQGEESHLVVRGAYRSRGMGTVSSGDGDLVAFAEMGASDDAAATKQNAVSIYSLKNLCDSFEGKNSGEHCELQHLEVARVMLPLQRSSSGDETATKLIGPTVLSIQGQYVIAGNKNGAILSAVTSMELPDSSSRTTDGANEFASCSTASLGLRGQLCPRLSAEANNVQLRNECTIQ